MKRFHIIIYSDPGHAWGKVKRKVLDNLGIADKVTAFSYQFNDNVYLEEDCDLSLLLGELRKHNTKVVFTEKHTERRSKIRSYQRYSAS